MISDLDILAAVEEYGSKAAAARALGLPRETVRDRCMKAIKEGVEISDLPKDGLPIAELLRQRKRRFEAKKEAMEARHLIPVRVRDRGPIGVAFVGDPHVDDDGTDLALLEEHLDIFEGTDGLYAINVGDTTNNWVGRLARLYSEQSTSAAEAWQLAEWMLSRVNWLAVIGGNHDVWSGAGDPLKWILARSVYEPFQVRLALTFPNRRVVKVNARHDFKGSSMWNPAHGAMKAAQMGFRDNILVCGHRHVSGYGLTVCPSSGVVNHAIQVASYKTFDRYAIELGLPNQMISPSVVTVINPDARSEAGLVSVFHDVEAGADFLTWLRQRK